MEDNITLKDRKKLYTGLTIALVSTVLTLAILKALYEAKVFDLILGIMKLKFNPRPIHKISGKSEMYITNHGEDEKYIMEEMANNNFKYMQKYGKSLLFEKEGNEVLVIKRNYFNRFDVYEIQNKKYYNDLV